MPEGTGLIYNTVHAEQGDSLEVPRDIDLYKNFKEETDMESVAEKLIDQGFTVTGREKKESGEYGLSLTLNTTPELDNINRVTSGILRIIEDRDAAFDGWGCPVTRSA